MTRQIRAPKNPDLLKAVIATLYSAANSRDAALPTVGRGRGDSRGGAAGRAAAAPKRSQIAKPIAKRLIANFDRLPKSTRSRLLGEVEAKNLKLPARRSSATSIPPATVSIPAEMLIDRTKLNANLAEILGDILEPVPTYTIRYQGLFCQKETSWDRGSWSDEPYLITSAVHIQADGQNVVRTETHPVTGDHYYDDVDDTDERIGPVAASWAGYADPVSLVVSVFEHDDGDPDAYHDEVDAIVKAAIAVATYFYPPAAALAALSGIIGDAFNWLLGSGDDLISTETVVLPQALLESYSTQGYTGVYQGYKIVWSGTQVKLVPFMTHLNYHFITEHKGSGADYVVGFDVTRDPAYTRDPIIL
jgi:hypothetical protein